jgi:hypothetical protein
MPHYNIRIAKGRKVVNPVGVELPNREAAKRHAEKRADGLTVLSRGFGMRHLGDWHVQVLDEYGKIVVRCEVPDEKRLRDAS